MSELNVTKAQDLQQTASSSAGQAIEQSKWKGHKITWGSLLTIPILLLKIPLFVVAGTLTVVASPLLAIGAVVILSNKDKAYNYVTNKILLDSRYKKPIDPRKVVPDDPELRANQKMQLIGKTIKERDEVRATPIKDTVNQSVVILKYIDNEVEDLSKLPKGSIFTFEEIEIIRNKVTQQLIENGVPHKGNHAEKFQESVDAIVTNVVTLDPIEARKLKTDADRQKFLIEKREIAKTTLLPNQINAAINADRASLFETIRIKTDDNIELDGMTITHPNQRDIPPENQTWIVFHLSKGSSYENELATLYRMSEETGTNILVYNYRGVGDSDDSDRASNIPITEALLVSDAEAVVRHLTNSTGDQKGVQHKNMIMMGHSQGGAIAAQVTAKHQEDDDYMHLAVMHTYRNYSEAAEQLVPIPFVGKLFAKAIKSRWEFNTEAVLPQIKGHVITVENPQDRVVNTRLRVDQAANRTHLQMSTEPFPGTKTPFFSSLFFGKHGADAHNITVYSYYSFDIKTRNTFTEGVKNAFLMVPPKEPHPDDLPLPPPTEPPPPLETAKPEVEEIPPPPEDKGLSNVKANDLEDEPPPEYPVEADLDDIPPPPEYPPLPDPPLPPPPAPPKL